jgi:hypothetical protein
MLRTEEVPAVDSSLQLSNFAQILVMASPFSITLQNMFTRTFSQANQGKMAISAVACILSAC